MIPLILPQCGRGPKGASADSMSAPSAGVTLATNGKLDEGLPLVKRALKSDPTYPELLKRLVDPPGIITKEQAEQLLREAK